MTLVPPLDQVQYLEEVESCLAGLRQYNEEADLRALREVQVGEGERARGRG